MRQVLRMLFVFTAVLAIGSLTLISLIKMLNPKPANTVITGADLKFAGAYEPLPAGTTSISTVYEHANPAVVRVTATHIVRETASEDEDLPDGHPEIDRRSRGVGTGCIIDEAGYIVTNQHVVDQAETVRVRLIDNSELPAQIIGVDKATDLALLKINAPARLSVMPLGDSNRLHIGDTVVAIGNPYSYDRSVTTGIVSAKGRKVFNTLYEDYIQTDAAINVGNSGGPLLNLSGELVGINTVIRADANGISFAIPVNQIKQVITQLQHSGHVVRGFLGIQPDTINSDVRDALGLNSTNGALVTFVNDDSAAAKAGIEVYDVITKFNGQEVTDKDALYRYIAETPPGQDVEIELIRNHSYKHVKAHLTEREEPKIVAAPPKNSLKKASFGRIGFSVQSHSNDERMMSATGSSKVSGVVVSEVDPLSAAADAGLQRGFIITEANRVPIRTVADFDHVVANLKDGEVVLLRVMGDRNSAQPYFITAIRLGE